MRNEPSTCNSDANEKRKAFADQPVEHEVAGATSPSTTKRTTTSSVNDHRAERERESAQLSSSRRQRANH